MGDLKCPIDGGEPQIEWKSTKSEKVETSIPFNFEDKNVEVAVTGKAFRHIVDKREDEPFLFDCVIVKGKVYARMSPENKAELVHYI